ncbi:MAG: hypothetical protein AAF251_03090 [Pseudomonadota bacterium]
MKSKNLVCLSLAAALAACASKPGLPGEGEMVDHSEHGSGHSGHDMAPTSEEAAEKQSHTEKLVERFDARGCGEAEVLATMRKTEPDGSATILRAYQAPTKCVTELNAAVETLGFSESKPGLFGSASAGGTTERILIEVADDGDGAVIEWEMDQK